MLFGKAILMIIGVFEQICGLDSLFLKTIRYLRRFEFEHEHYINVPCLIVRHPIFDLRVAVLAFG